MAKVDVKIFIHESHQASNFENSTMQNVAGDPTNCLCMSVATIVHVPDALVLQSQEAIKQWMETELSKLPEFLEFEIQIGASRYYDL